MTELVEKFYKIWAEKTQLTNGLFEQRYYSNGELAPSWGIQIDETSSVIIGISKLKNPKKYKDVIMKATFGLISFLNDDFILFIMLELFFGLSSLGTGISNPQFGHLTFCPPQPPNVQLHSHLDASSKSNLHPHNMHCIKFLHRYLRLFIFLILF